MSAMGEHRARCLEQLPLRALASARKAINTPALEGLKRWLHESGRSIAVLAGGVGTGKTVAACWLVWWHWVFYSQWRYISAFDLARAVWHRDEVLNERKPWIIDDLGAEYRDLPGEMVTALDERISIASRDKSTLIIATDLTEAQLSARYGQRIVARLAESGMWIHCGSRSLRRNRLDMSGTPGERRKR